MPSFLKVPKSVTVMNDTPEAIGALPPGESTLPLEKWHAMGDSPEVAAALAAETVRVVHKRHEFQDGDAHCIGCSLTREQAEAERKAAQPAKGKTLAEAAGAVRP